MSRAIPIVSGVPTIILGMDVSHGPPGQSDRPSIAAVRDTVLLSEYNHLNDRKSCYSSICNSGFGFCSGG